MHNQREIKKVFIANNCARTAGLTASNLTSLLGPGEIAVLDEKGNLLATAAAAKAAKAIRIYQGLTGGGVTSSDLIQKGKINSFKGFKFVQSSEQRVAIGYNGTSGSIDLFDDNNYVVTIEYDNTGSQISNDFDLHKLLYKSPLINTTQHDVAIGIAAQYAAVLETVNASFGIKVNVSTDAVGVVLAVGLTGCEVIKGSRAVLYTTGTPVVGGSYTIAGITGTPYADEVTSVYKVVAIDTVNKTVTLDRPYQNEFQTGIDLAFIANTSLNNYGVVFEGMLNKFQVGFGDYIKTFIHVQTSGFGNSEVTRTGAGFSLNQGKGRHEAVSIEEFYYQGNAMSHGASREFAQYANETKVGYGYSGITIDYYSNDRINIAETSGADKSLVIFVERGTYQNIYDDVAGTALLTNVITGTGADTVNGSSFLNVLNAFMVGTGVITTGLNLTNNSGLSLAAAGIFSLGIDL
jgi:hypothetical protein